MQAAVQAAEADRSETYSGRSTEDAEVRSQSRLASFRACSDQQICMAEAETSQACPSVFSAAGVHLNLFCLKMKNSPKCLSSVMVLEDCCYHTSG